LPAPKRNTSEARKRRGVIVPTVLEGGCKNNGTCERGESGGRVAGNYTGGGEEKAPESVGNRVWGNGWSVRKRRAGKNHRKEMSGEKDNVRRAHQQQSSQNRKRNQGKDSSRKRNAKGEDPARVTGEKRDVKHGKRSGKETNRPGKILWFNALTEEGGSRKGNGSKDP